MSQLTGHQIVEQQIITGFCDAGIQQQGIDVRIGRIMSLSGVGIVPAEGKTVIPQTTPIKPSEPYNSPGGNRGWYLNPGWYEVELLEGAHIPDNVSMHFKTRSSLVRCGAVVHSGQFDAGFNTDRAGCFLEVIRPIRIEVGARIAQAICFTSDKVENTYNGQWQGDKQRDVHAGGSL